MLEPETACIHRLEVISGTGRRRRFSDEFRARVLEETLVPGAVVSQIARRHGLTPQQVFTWRRQARMSAAVRADATPSFVPAVIDRESPIPIAGSARPGHRRRARSAESSGVIEVEIGGNVIRVARGADAETVAAVIAALKSTT